MQVALTNAQSLPSHIDEFRKFFADKAYHLIAVTESWLKEYMYDASVLLEHYYLLRRDRSFAGSGGVCLYVHDSLKAKCIKTWNDVKGRPEFMMVEIGEVESTKILFCIVYRPPRIGHFDDFADAFADVSHLYTDIIIVGDFNINMLAENCHTRMIRDFTASQGVNLILSNPTHHTSRSHTWLDLVMVDNHEKITFFGQSGTPFLSGHELISFHYDYFIAVPASNFVFLYRNFKSFNPNNYLDSLQHALDNLSSQLIFPKKYRQSTQIYTKS